MVLVKSKGRDETRTCNAPHDTGLKRCSNQIMSHDLALCNQCSLIVIFSTSLTIVFVRPYSKPTRLPSKSKEVYSLWI